MVSKQKIPILARVLPFSPREFRHLPLFLRVHLISSPVSSSKGRREEEEEASPYFPLLPSSSSSSSKPLPSLSLPFSMLGFKRETGGGAETQRNRFHDSLPLKAVFAHPRVSGFSTRSRPPPPSRKGRSDGWRHAMYRHKQSSSHRGRSPFTV